MSILNHIIDDVNNGKRVIKDWTMLHNAYFRGDNGLKDLKKWADEHGLIALECDIVEQSLTHKIFKSVEFIKKT